MGVDIAPDYIRATEIERVGEDYYLRNIGLKATPEGAVIEGHIVDTAAVARSLRSMFRERRFETNRVVSAVRGKGVVSRIITLPSMPQERLSRLIENEVNRYVIFSEQDKVVFYYPLEEFDEYDRRKVNVLLVVAQKNICNSYYETFKQAKLDLVSLDYSTFAILRELRNSTKHLSQGNTMTVIFDHHGASLNIFHRDIMRYTRTVKFDTERFSSAANGFLDRIVAETLLSLQYYQTESLGREPISRMVLSLGATGSSDAYSALQESIDDIPVEAHAPFSNIKVNMDDFPPDLMEQVDTNFLTSIGLSLRGQELEFLPFQVDLMPAEIAEGKTLAQHMKWLLVALGLIVIGFMIPGQFILPAQERAAENEQARLKMDLQANETKLTKLKRQQETAMRLNPLAVDAPLTDNWSPLLEGIKKVIPRNVQLTSLSMEPPDNIEFMGIADSNPSIFYFVSSLRKSPDFVNVELGPRNAVPVYDKPMVNFVIHCRYIGPKE